MAEGVKIRVSSDSSKAQRDIRSLTTNVQRLSQTADNVTRTFNRVGTAIAAAFVGTAFTRGINRATDSVIELENRVALVVGRGEDLQKNLKQLYGLAAAARQPVAVAADTFNRFGLALKDAGIEADALLLATEAVQKAATISGASAQTASMSIMQLGQGLASGELRGQELNSVLEGIPRLAKAIAEGMGIPFGELRERAKAGELTTMAVFEAIIKQAQSIDSEFEGLEITTSGLLAVFGDEFRRAISVLDKELLGFSSSFKSTIETATIVLRLFSDNFPQFMRKIELTFFKFRLAFTKGLFQLEDSIEDFFGIQISADAFTNAIKESFKEAASSVDASIIKPIQDAINSATENIDFSKLIGFDYVADIDVKLPNLENVLQSLSEFTQGIKDIFKALIDRLFINSLWAGIFDHSKREPGQEASISKAYLDTVTPDVLGSLTAFKDEIIRIFTIINTEVSRLWATSVGVIVDEAGKISVNLDAATDDLVSKLETNTQAIKEGFANIAFDNETKLAIKRVVKTLEPLAIALTPVSKRLKVFFNGMETNYSTLETLRKQELGIIEGETLPAYERLSLGIQSVIQSFKDLIPTQEQALNFADRLGTDLKGGLDLYKSAFNLDQGDFREPESKSPASTIFTGLKEVANKFSDSLGFTLEATLAGVFLALGGIFVLGITKSILLAGGAALVFGLTKTGALKEVLGNLGEGLGALIRNGAGDFSDIVFDFVIDLLDALGEFSTGFFRGLGLDYAPFTSDFSQAVFGGFTAGFILWKTSKTFRAGLKGIGSLLSFALFQDDKPRKGRSFRPYLKGVGGGLMAGLKGLFNPTTLRPLVTIPFRAALAAGFAKLAGLLGVGGAAVAAVATGPFAWVIGAFSLALAGGFALFKSDSKLKQDIIDSFIPSEGFKNRLKEIYNFWKDLFGKIPTGISFEGSVPNRSIGTLAASGGYISGPGTSTSDSIPARLSNGEFVVRASAVNKYGRNFMASLNSGNLVGFKNGNAFSSDKALAEIKIAEAQVLIGDELKELNTMLQGAYRQLVRQAGLDGEILRSGIQRLIRQATDPNDIEALKRLLDINKLYVIPSLEVIKKENEKTAKNTEEINDKTPKSSGTPSTADGPSKPDTERGKAYAERFTTDLKANFAEAFKTGNFKNFFANIFNSLTNNIIDSFSESLVDGLFGTGDNNAFNKLFIGMADFGTQIGTSVVTGFNDGVNKGKIGSMISEIAVGLGSLLVESVSAISNMFGYSKGKGGPMKSFANPVFDILEFFGFGLNEGGIVPSYGGQRGIDSVPAMLTPGELVVPTNRVGEFMNGSGRQTVFNLNITGDVSRQTRNEIVKMMPEITSGVNFNNTENNYRGQ